MRSWAKRLLAIATAVFALAGASSVEAAKYRHPLLGRAAPDVLQHLQSGPAGNFRLSERRGEVVLLGFWTSWCAACSDYLNQLQSFDSTYRSAGLVVLAISLDEDRQLAREFVRPFGQQLRTSNDDPVKIGELYEVKDVPMSVLIDRDGVVRFVHLVHDHANQLAMQRELRTLLDE
jgi:thiol-disulfide isomerase/thioredoxin